MWRQRTGLLACAVILAIVGGGAATAVLAQTLSYTPVVTPNGETLPWKMVDGAKEFHLVVQEIEWEMAPGMVIHAWGFNGRTPGPTIEAVEGDRVRILVTNELHNRRPSTGTGCFFPAAWMESPA